METIHSESHLSDDTLELCALGRLSREQAPAVFDHLMICDECNSRLEAEQDFITTFREAAPQLEREKSQPAARGWFNLASFPKPVWAAGMAMALILLIVPLVRQGGGPLQTVELTAVRSELSATARAGSPIDLRLDGKGIEARGPVRVKVVDAAGEQVWDGTAASRNGGWQFVLDRNLAAGRYWVRVLAPENENEIIREFQLNLE